MSQILAEKRRPFGANEPDIHFSAGQEIDDGDARLKIRLRMVQVVSEVRHQPTVLGEVVPMAIKGFYCSKSLIVVPQLHAL